MIGLSQALLLSFYYIPGICYLVAGAKLNVGWIRSVFYDVIHLFTPVLVDYDAKNASNPPYKKRIFNFVPATI